MEDPDGGRVRLVYPFAEGAGAGRGRWRSRRASSGCACRWAGRWAWIKRLGDPRRGRLGRSSTPACKTPATAQAWSEVFAKVAGAASRSRARLRDAHAPRPHRHGRLDHAQVRLPPVDHAAGIHDVPDAGRRHRPRSARGRHALLSLGRLGTRPRSTTTPPGSAASARRCTPCPTASAGWSTARPSASATTTGRSWSENGHSPEHACLYCADLKLMISGDQVLPPHHLPTCRCSRPSRTATRWTTG